MGNESRCEGIPVEGEHSFEAEAKVGQCVHCRLRRRVEEFGRGRWIIRATTYQVADEPWSPVMPPCWRLVRPEEVAP